MASTESSFPTDEAIYKDERRYKLLSALRSIPCIAGASCQPVACSPDEADEELRVRIGMKNRAQFETIPLNLFSSDVLEQCSTVCTCQLEAGW